MLTQTQFNNCLPQFNQVLCQNLCCHGPGITDWKCDANYVRAVADSHYTVTTVSYSKHETRIRLSFTVSFHENYATPVCCFRLWINGTISFAPDTVPSSAYMVDTHHILAEPWLMIHPCENANTVSEFVPPAASPLRLLICWFGVCGLPSVIPDLSLRAITLY